MPPGNVSNLIWEKYEIMPSMKIILQKDPKSHKNT